MVHVKLEIPTQHLDEQVECAFRYRNLSSVTGVNAQGTHASPLLFPFPVALNNMYMLLKPKTIALVHTVCRLQIHIIDDENI